MDKCVYLPRVVQLSVWGPGVRSSNGRSPYDGSPLGWRRRRVEQETDDFVFPTASARKIKNFFSWGYMFFGSHEIHGIRGSL